MKKYKKIILGVIATFILLIAALFIYMTNGLESGKVMVVNHVDVAKLADGTYSGKYDGGRWSNEVSVKVSNGKIIEISIIKSVAIEDAKITKELINSVIKNQDTAIDVVSGATVTSKAYLKSIENALSK